MQGRQLNLYTIEQGLDAAFDWEEHVMFAKRVARSVVRKFFHQCDIDEYEAIALQALCDCKRRYRERCEVSFQTFAYLRVRGAVFDEAKKHYLRNKREVGYESEIDELRGVNMETVQKPDDLIEASQRAEKIRELVSSLACRNEKRVIELLYLHSRTQSEVAHLLGKSVSWVSRYHRDALYSLQLACGSRSSFL